MGIHHLRASRTKDYPPEAGEIAINDAARCLPDRRRQPRIVLVKRPLLPCLSAIGALPSASFSCYQHGAAAKRAEYLRRRALRTAADAVATTLRRFNAALPATA